MANKDSRLLSTEEQWDIYSPPALNAFERAQYFRLSSEEVMALESFQSIGTSVYFAICLVFLKLKGTLIKFKYQEVTLERQYIMERYFTTRKSPRSFPSQRDLIATIENKALKLCGYHRCTEQHKKKIQAALQQQAAHHPRQRKLCKVLLDLLTEHRIVIPPYSVLQAIVAEVWSKENKRIINAYCRATNKKERETVYSLLNKADSINHIANIKKDMRGFNNAALTDEIEKLQQLTPVFSVAMKVIPKLKLPTTAINYYASLVDYYNGHRLKKLEPYQAQLYLLCYALRRCSEVKDNFMAALKKRTTDYKSAGDEFSKKKSSEQLITTKEARIKASNTLIAIHDYKKDSVPKPEIYRHIPENELLDVAQKLVDKHLDKDYLYWQYIDSISDAIKLSLRPLFLHSDFVVIKNEPLKMLIETLSTYLNSATKSETITLPSKLKLWIEKMYPFHILKDDAAIVNRLEFLVYDNIAHHIATNKLTLKHSIKYKPLEDALIPQQVWDKEGPKIINKIGYKALNTPIEQLLAEKKKNITELYHIVNKGILSGENTGVKIKIGKDGRKTWRLKPLGKKSDPNESLFADFPRLSIVDVAKFVSEKTKLHEVFEPILAKNVKNEKDFRLILAAILANATRIGCRKMADISDLNESSLLTAEASYVYNETLQAALDIVNKKATEIPLFKKWYLGGKYHGSADGFKLEVELKHVMARYSKKYLGTKMGVSSYNNVLNHFSFTGCLINNSDYEGDYTFEMAEHQNAPELKIDILSTDKHGSNMVNYGLFDLTDRLLAPRIPRPHRETFWGFKDIEFDEDYIIKPKKFANEKLMAKEWSNAQRFVASLIMGDTPPNITIRKMASKYYTSHMKRAFTHYNHLVRTEFLLLSLHDKNFKRAIMTALNRGEAYNNLYRAIAILKNGALRGNNTVEMEIWNQCTRLVAAIILYYNTYILNELYERATDEKIKAYLLSLSPGAWIHINFFGYFRFFAEGFYGEIEHWIQEWNGFDGIEDLLKN